VGGGLKAGRRFLMPIHPAHNAWLVADFMPKYPGLDDKLKSADKFSNYKRMNKLQSVGAD
jgi:hypothetical protein